MNIAKNKYLLIIVGSIVLIILAVIFWQVSHKKNLIETPKSIKNEPVKTVKINKDTTPAKTPGVIAYGIMEDALETNKPDLCNDLVKVTGQEAADSCFYSASQVYRNQELCNRIVNTVKKQTCLDVYLLLMSNQNLVPNICNQIKTVEVKNDCFDRIFNEYKDLKGCDTQEGVLKTRCISLVNYKKAVLSTDVSGCSILTDKVLNDQCKNVVSKKKAFKIK